MLHGLLQPDLERQIADLERSVPRVPVRVRAIDDELLLPCPQSCAPLKHGLRQSNATARRAVLADPDASALLRRVGAACISPMPRPYLAHISPTSRPYYPCISQVGAALGYASTSEALSRLDQAREVAACYVAHAEDPPVATSEADAMLTMEEATLPEKDVLGMMSLSARLWRETYSDPVVARLGVGRLLHATI